jgi:putative membrane protein
MGSEVSPVRDERQRWNWLGFVQAAVIAGWITALAWLGHGSGDDALLSRFLRADYWWIVYMAIWVFGALLASLVVSRPQHLGLDRRRGLIQAIILALPLFYLPLALSSNLSIEAAEKRSLYTPRVTVKQAQPSRAIAAGAALGGYKREERSVSTPQEIGGTLDPPEPVQAELTPETPSEKPRVASIQKNTRKATLLDLVSDPESFEGSTTTLIGMVHQDKRLPPGSFYCYRLLMVCCAADASPIGIIVKWPQTRALKKGAWVRVQGTVGFSRFEKENYPTISATGVEVTKPPKNRFIVPKH